MKTGRLTLCSWSPPATALLTFTALFVFWMERSCPPQAKRRVTATYTGTIGPQNLSICQRTEIRSEPWFGHQ